MAVIVENGESGGLTVAPIIHEVMKATFGEAPPTSETENSEAVRDAEVRGD